MNGYPWAFQDRDVALHRTRTKTYTRWALYDVTLISSDKRKKKELYKGHNYLSACSPIQALTNLLCLFFIHSALAVEIRNPWPTEPLLYLELSIRFVNKMPEG